LVTSAALIVGSARRNSTPMPPSRPEKPAPSSVELPAAVATSTASPPETVPSELPGTTTDKGAAGLAKPPKPSPRPGAEAVGRLSLQSDPWTFVYLGKKLLGETPLIDVPLKAGQYQLRLVNEESSISTVIEVNIQPSKQTTLNLKL
jgi:serine/threonine-protein kinase